MRLPSGVCCYSKDEGLAESGRAARGFVPHLPGVRGKGVCVTPSTQRHLFWRQHLYSTIPYDLP